MPPRLFVDSPLSPAVEFELPPGASRHVQVLRLQPGDAVTLFDGAGGEWRSEVTQMGRQRVSVRALAHVAVDRELPVAVTLAVGMPANERMDALVEKATELGVHALQPLMAERSVLRLSGERAERRQAHWQAVAVSAAEQSGRTQVPQVLPIRQASEWMRSAQGTRWVLSLGDGVQPLAAVAPGAGDAVSVLSGPEGGLSPAEDALARSSGFQPIGLGPRVLRADTAPLAVLAMLGLRA